MLQMDTNLQEPEYDMWRVPIIQTVAVEDKGIDDLISAINNHGQHLVETGMNSERERLRLQTELVGRLQDALLKKLLDATPAETLETLLQQILDRQLDPASAVRQLVEDKPL